MMLMIGTDELDEQVFPEEEEERILSEEVEVFRAERMVLIKIHTTLIKVAIEAYNKSSKNDVTMQFLALNLLNSVFSRLLPVPTLLNLVMIS